jgi:Flp pilus assembly protein TadD
MQPVPFFRGHAPRSIARSLVVLTLGLTLPLMLGGCKSTRLSDITGSIGGNREAGPPSEPAALQKYTEDWGKRYERDPSRKDVVIAYARGLRMQGKYSQAIAVLQQMALRNPNDMEVLGYYGKALADGGRLDEAAGVLRQAHTADQPNWSIYSAQGSVADQLGEHGTAQGFYQEALRLNPGEPSVLSNYGLSLALSKQLPKAEEALRQAAEHPRADSRVRQNLALVLSLQGKFSEAEVVAGRDLPPEQAASNVATIRQMIAQSNTWRDIQNGPQQSVAAAR